MSSTGRDARRKYREAHQDSEKRQAVEIGNSVGVTLTVDGGPDIEAGDELIVRSDGDGYEIFPVEDTST